jgi:hypothetical protein
MPKCQRQQAELNGCTWRLEGYLLCQQRLELAVACLEAFSNNMQLLMKVGIAIGTAIILAAAGGFGLFYLNGPHATLKGIDSLHDPGRLNKVLAVSRPLMKTIKEGDVLYPDDKRGASIAKALFPVPYSYVALVHGKLWIECGGGFYHFGYEIEEDEEGICSIAFTEEEKAPKKLKSTAQ